MRPFRYGSILCALVLVFGAGELWADTLIYRSGRKVEGRMIHINGFRVLFRLKNGKDIVVPSTQIRRVVFKKPARPAAKPEPPPKKPVAAPPPTEPAPARKPPRPAPKPERKAPVTGDQTSPGRSGPSPVRESKPGESAKENRQQELAPSPGAGRTSPELFREERTSVVQGPDRILYAARPVRVTLAPASNDESSTIYYSLNNGPTAKYAAPFLLSQDGFYHVRYYGVDAAGNREVLRHKKVYVDRSPPRVSTDFQGTAWTDRKGVTFLGSPFVFLRAHDDHTGVAAFRCRLDDEVMELSEEGGVVSLPRAGKTFELTCQARDRVGNQGERTVYVHLDDSGPRIAWRRTSGLSPVTSGTRIAFTVEDARAGVVALRLLVDDQVHMLAPDARSFAPADYESKTGVERTFVLVAEDRAGNQTRSEPIRLRIDKKPPVSELKIAK